MSRPIVLTSPMDGSPQVVRFDATTLWHFDAAEWAPSTASNSALGRCLHNLRITPESAGERSSVDVSKCQKATSMQSFRAPPSSVALPDNCKLQDLVLFERQHL